MRLQVSSALAALALSLVVWSSAAGASISCGSIALAPELQRVVSREMTMFPIYLSPHNLRRRGSVRF